MQRERLTITLDSELLAAIDTTVDNSTIRNRSHAIEHLLRNGLSLIQMRQAFLIVGEDWDSTSFPKIITLCEKLGITQYYLVPTEVTAPLAQELVTSISHLTHGAQAQVVAGDFGSGGALTLLKSQLVHDFLIISLGATLRTPKSLLSAYTNHIHTGGTVTQLLSSEDGQEFSATGFSFAKPELLNEVSAGYVSLEETIFPALLKAGKLVGYVI